MELSVSYICRKICLKVNNNENIFRNSRKGLLGNIDIIASVFAGLSRKKLHLKYISYSSIERMIYSIILHLII